MWTSKWIRKYFQVEIDGDLFELRNFWLALDSSLVQLSLFKNLLQNKLKLSSRNFLTRPIFVTDQTSSLSFISETFLNNEKSLK